MMSQREYRKDIETLEELHSPIARTWGSLSFYNKITDSRDYMRAWSAMEWLRKFVPQLKDILEASGSIDRGYISQALEHLSVAEQVLLKYQPKK
ncbi:hypothetical protein HY485_04405 [Candidatus Woesearchaeota archaeon]|nr:hypothetical protein [Candidatus Woesearchaeota archaeon]